MAEATILTHYLCAKADKVFLEDRVRFFLVRLVAAPVDEPAFCVRFFLVILVAAPVDEPAFCFRFFLVLLVAAPVDEPAFCFRLRGFLVTFFTESIFTPLSFHKQLSIFKNFGGATCTVSLSSTAQSLRSLNCFPRGPFCAILPCAPCRTFSKSPRV